MSIEDDSSSVPPGWYPDPADATRLRRWDGEQWTQEVLLNPEQAPAAFAPEQPAVAPQPAPPVAQDAPPIIHDAPPLVQDAPPAPAAPPSSPTFQAAPPPASPGQPPAGQPVPASAPPTSAPPVAAPPVQTSEPRPSPPVNQHQNTSSGPVSLPEWANLPGLTLPPDLSSIPGMETDSVLRTPTFAESHPHELPTLPVFEPPFIPQRPDVHDADSRRTRDRSTPAPQHAHSAQDVDSAPPAAPTTPYAPPPVGVQYDVPPPPGMGHLPSSGTVLPPSAFVAPPSVVSAWPELPPVGSTAPVAPASPAPASPAQASAVRAPLDHAEGALRRTEPASPSVSTATISSWLIAALPLLQFAAVYVLFKVLAVELAPGMQWGILAVPAAFSLLFANADRKKLTTLDLPSPSIVFALIPPLYLLIRCVTTARSSVVLLVVWVVLQAGAVAGVYFLLPDVLATAIRAIG